jgi:HEAT repeat protein
VIDSGPIWPQRLAAAPGRDDIDRAIALLDTTDGEDYDYNAVDFLANELSIARDRRIVDALIEVIANASFPTRDLAATALAKYGETQARTVIMERLKDAYFAGPLIVALGKLGDEQTMRELEYIAERTDDPLVAQNANLAKQLIEERLDPK